MDGGAGYSFLGAPSIMDNISFQTYDLDSDYYYYVDAIIYDWDTEHDIEDNLVSVPDVETDITSDCGYRCVVKKELNKESVTDFDSILTITNDDYIRIFDRNGDLCFEGEISKSIGSGRLRRYKLKDKNRIDLEEQVDKEYTNKRAYEIISDVLGDCSRLVPALIKDLSDDKYISNIFTLQEYRL